VTPAQKLRDIKKDSIRIKISIPTTMPRQRSKKLSASRKTVQDSMPQVDHEDEQSGSDNENLEISEKDAEEEELDRLVLGDGSTFMTQLGRGVDVDYEEDSDGAGGLEDENEGEEGLKGVDDADVRTTP
jgi:U3 small nucleolar RNA-associated protein 18